MTRLFISYSHSDKTAVKAFIVDMLRHAGHDPWFDYKLLPGQNWQEELLKKIENCEGFVYALSPESVQSEYCLWEFAKAIELNKPVMPVLIRKVELPESLSKIQYADFTDGFTQEAVARLVGGLHQQIPPENAPTVPSAPTEHPAEARVVVTPQTVHKGLEEAAWTNLLRRIDEGTCTPVIGSSICTDASPTKQDIAKKWSEKYGYPLRAHLNIRQRDV